MTAVRPPSNIQISTRSTSDKVFIASLASTLMVFRASAARCLQAARRQSGRVLAADPSVKGRRNLQRLLNLLAHQIGVGLVASRRQQIGFAAKHVIAF